jgi:hypothetical protein
MQGHGWDAATGLAACEAGAASAVASSKRCTCCAGAAASSIHSDVVVLCQAEGHVQGFSTCCAVTVSALNCNAQAAMPSRRGSAGRCAHRARLCVGRGAWRARPYVGARARQSGNPPAAQPHPGPTRSHMHGGPHAEPGHLHCGAPRRPPAFEAPRPKLACQLFVDLLELWCGFFAGCSMSIEDSAPAPSIPTRPPQAGARPQGGVAGVMQGRAMKPDSPLRLDSRSRLDGRTPVRLDAWTGIPACCGFFSAVCAARVKSRCVARSERPGAATWLIGHGRRL